MTVEPRNGVLCVFLPMAGITLVAALLVDALISGGSRLLRRGKPA